MKRYELVHSDTIEINGRTLYRIRALRDIQARDPYRHQPIVHKGDLGGYIESEYNLVQYGESWVFPGAVVFDYARVSGHARVFGPTESCKFGPTRICGYAKIRGRSTIYGSTIATDGIHLYGDAMIGQISDNLLPDSIIKLYGNVRIHGNAHIIRGIAPDSLITIQGDVDLSGNIKLVDTSLSGVIILKTPLTCNGMVYADR